MLVNDSFFLFDCIALAWCRVEFRMSISFLGWTECFTAIVSQNVLIKAVHFTCFFMVMTKWKKHLYQCTVTLCLSLVTVHSILSAAGGTGAGQSEAAGGPHHRGNLHWHDQGQARPVPAAAGGGMLCWSWHSAHGPWAPGLHPSAVVRKLDLPVQCRHTQHGVADSAFEDFHPATILQTPNDDSMNKMILV